MIHASDSDHAFIGSRITRRRCGAVIADRGHDQHSFLLCCPDGATKQSVVGSDQTDGDDRDVPLRHPAQGPGNGSRIASGRIVAIYIGGQQTARIGFEAT